MIHSIIEENMLLRRTSTTAAAAAFYHLSLTIFRHFSSKTAASCLPKPFSKIPWKYRTKAIKESQKALTDYLHTTRSLPFPYADLIASNSPHSLWKIVSKIPFSPSTFTSSFQRFLRYHPINELDFFLESIGLNGDVDGNQCSFSLPSSLFLSDWKQFDVFPALSGMGFPWSKLGLLYKDERVVFEVEPEELQVKITKIKDFYGFSGVCLIGICLAFPRILYGKMEGLLSDLKVVFVDYDLDSSIEGNVDSVLEVCRKIRLFYDLGCEMGKAGELMGKNKCVFLDYSEDVLVRTIGYFCKLNVLKDQVGWFLLSKPEVFGFDLGPRVISVAGLLEHFGLGREEIKSLTEMYPHVFGRNKIDNLPHIMRSMGLGEWFFQRMRNGDHHLLRNYALCNMDEDFDKRYADNFLKVKAKRTHIHAIKKLNFLHGIGFGENKFTVRALALLNSSDSQLQRRFNCLLRCGIEYSKLCAMLRQSPKILNQQDSILERKIEYLCMDMGSSLDYLDVFPGYLCYDLEKRIKPRYELHKWLVKNGFCEKEYSLSTIIATSEKQFIDRISRIHPDAARKWLEN